MPTQSILAIETSVETGSVALCAKGEVICERSFFAGRKPSATLWPALEEVMAEVESLDAIVVGIGPGSYNGSRVGIAAAQGIALVHDCAVAPLCSFEGVATATNSSLAIGDARRGSFSLQKVEAGRIAGDFALVDVEGLASAIRASAHSEQEVFSFDPRDRFPVESSLQGKIHRRQSEASRLAKAFANRKDIEQKILLEKLPEPFYLRAPHITIGKRKSLLNR